MPSTTPQAPCSLCPPLVPFFVAALVPICLAKRKDPERSAELADSLSMAAPEKLADAGPKRVYASLCLRAIEAYHLVYALIQHAVRSAMDKDERLQVA